jgi:hypothetical protein
MRYSRHIQAYAENSPADVLGLTTALEQTRHFLLWTGEIAAQLPSKTMAILYRRLLAEATTAAWQDYLLCNALLAALAVIPALLVHQNLWRRQQSPTAAAETPEVATEHHS